MSNKEDRPRFTLEEAQKEADNRLSVIAHVVKNPEGDYSVMSHIVCEWCDYCTEQKNGIKVHDFKEDPYEIEEAGQREWDKEWIAQQEREKQKVKDKTMDKNELKKELMRSKAVAKLRHYCGGKLEYLVESENGKRYMFSIPTVEEMKTNLVVGDVPICTYKGVELSRDLGTTPFVVEEKASMLWRWIDKAIDKGDFISLPLSPSGMLFYQDKGSIPPPPEPPPDRIIREGEEPEPPRIR